MIITLSGQPGSGKTSVAKELCAKYGFTLISAGEQFRKMAAERNMTLEQFGALCEADPLIDLEIDSRQKALSSKYPMALVEGRLAGRSIDADMKIWLKTPLEVRAKRIAGREGSSFERALEETRTREACELTRYKKHYNIDLYDMSFYDVIIDTAKWDSLGVSSIVFAAIDALKKG